MIKRFDVSNWMEITESKDGDIVFYSDHAAEMREVLWALQTEGNMHEVLAKYAHYLEDK